MADSTMLITTGPDENTINRVLNALIDGAGDATEYERGVRDALGWVLGDYDAPERLRAEFYDRATGVIDEETS